MRHASLEMTEARSKSDSVTGISDFARIRFQSRFGTAPRLFQAPGRINIIGEHTDYSGGLVMPAAINRYCIVAAKENGTRRLKICAGAFAGEADLDLEALTPNGSWADYVAGVASVLETEGIEVPGADLWIESDVPIGGGVSSSAALEVAVAHALLAMAGKQADGVEIAKWAQAAENRFVGMPCGIMDQFASANGIADSALMLDCTTLKVEAIPLPKASSFVIVDSMVRHAHVEGEYRNRREDCEAAADALGVSLLSEIGAKELPAALTRLSPRIAKRCRHVVSENDRVRIAAAALKRGDIEHVGRLMNQSHASLRDDMEVSENNLDRLAAIAQKTPGVFGARMMGGGFGGCIIALVGADQAERVSIAIQSGYGDVVGRKPKAFVCRAVAGGGEIAA